MLTRFDDSARPGQIRILQRQKSSKPRIFPVCTRQWLDSDESDNSSKSTKDRTLVRARQEQLEADVRRTWETPDPQRRVTTGIRKNARV
jgi:hypothetical protein